MSLSAKISALATRIGTQIKTLTTSINAVKTTADGALQKSGGTVTGTLSLSSAPAATANNTHVPTTAWVNTAITRGIAASAPFKGIISDYYGSLDSTGKHPLVDGKTWTDWQICDGTNGTPDLRNKFVIGASSSYALGVVGGSIEPEVVDESSFDYSMSTNSVSTELELHVDLPPFVALYKIMKIG